MVAGVQVLVRKFPGRLPTARVFILFNGSFFPRVYPFIGVCAMRFVPRTPPTRNRFRPLLRLWKPLLCPPSTYARVQSRFEFVEIGGDMSSNCTGDVKAGTGISGWYQLLVPRKYKYDNIGYVEVPEDHLYKTRHSGRSHEVSPYLMVACVHVPVRKLLLLLLLLSLLLLLLSKH